MRPSTIQVNSATASPWHPLDWGKNPFHVSVGVSLDGTSGITYDLEYTYVNVMAGDTPASDQVFTALSAKTAAAEYQFSAPVAAVRLALSAHTSGAALATILQAG